jgi:mannose-6-phosphate isomerase-like protein (cupin superfamily)
MEANVAFPVYDYRTDIRNILVTPEIRARFMRLEVGGLSRGRQAGPGHSHDLGHEVFLVLQGQAEFNIDGETQVLGPGQMCVAMTDQVHTLRNVGDEPVILYLSVTPHIQPTHTGWTDEGEREPLRFSPSSVYDVPPDQSTPTEALLDRHLDAADALVQAAEAARDVQREQGRAFKEALADGDRRAALQARDAMWAALYPLFREVYQLADAWNDLTYRTADPAFQAEEG